MDMVMRGRVAISVAAAVWLAAVRPVAAAEPPRWLGDDLPLPLAVKTPQDIGFKAAAERQYLIFNLMAGGKLAYQRGDYAVAVEKWETLLRISGLDAQIEKAVMPLLTDARAKVAHGNGGHAETAPDQTELPPVDTKTVEQRETREPRGHSSATQLAVRRPAVSQISVSGTVSGGGQIGPGGTVVWLKRLDGAMPRIAPPSNQVVTQREKTFLRWNSRYRRDIHADIQQPGRRRDLVQHSLNHERVRVRRRLAALREGTGVGRVHDSRRRARALRAGGVARSGVGHHAQDDRGRP
jgi:hypothetical protein